MHGRSTVAINILLLGLAWTPTGKTIPTFEPPPPPPPTPQCLHLLKVVFPRLPLTEFIFIVPPAPIPLLASFCDRVPLCCLGNYNHNYSRTGILLVSFNEAIASYLLLELQLWANVEIKTYAHN